MPTDDDRFDTTDRSVAQPTPLETLLIADPLTFQSSLAQDAHHVRGKIPLAVACFILGTALVAVGFAFAPITEAKFSQLEVLTTPAGAIIFVDGDLRGATPVNVRGLRPGAHQIKAIMPGFQSMEVQLEIRPRAKDTLEWHLMPAPAMPLNLQVASLTDAPIGTGLQPGVRRGILIPGRGARG